MLSLGRSKPVLNKPSVRKDIQDLHDRYIIVPADKAANNFDVVCENLYVEVLFRELGIDAVTFMSIGNSTYCMFLAISHSKILFLSIRKF